MSLQFSEGFRGVNRTVEKLLSEHSKREIRPELGEVFLEVDRRPEQDLRIQFSHGGEAAPYTSNGRMSIGSISVTGMMETSMTPDRGWHVFNLIYDGAIEQSSVPSNGSEHIVRDLEEPQKIELAQWLENNKAVFLAS